MSTDDDHHVHDEEHDHDHARGGLRERLLSFLRPHSHDSADSVDAQLESSQRGIWALKISLFGLAATASFQVIIFLISGSVALLADTIHNFSDALTAVPPRWLAGNRSSACSTRSRSATWAG